MRKSSAEVETKPKLEPIIIEEDAFFDVIIIGGGPAGLSAAIYAIRQGLKTMLIEKALLGGTVLSAYEIENYPGFPEAVAGADLAKRLEEQAKALGLKVGWGEVQKVSFGQHMHQITYEDKTLQAKTIIIATGAESKKLGVPGENDFRGRGVSYCAICDGPFYKNKSVAVVGGGNSAIEEALFLAQLAEKVFIIHRRGELRADKITERKARSNPKIYFHWDSVIEKINGDNKVTNITIKNIKNSQNTTLNVDGVFIYIGIRPNTQLFKGSIKMNDSGFICADNEMKTSVEGVFAAGDAREKSLYQIVTAVSDGAVSAFSAYKYITDKFGD